MALDAEITKARRRVVTDGYDMSVGEIISLFKQGELEIDPEYQRLFRWEESQKTRFIESLLLGIPTPPIFVSTKANGAWELIDGLQRVSTLLQFFGEHPKEKSLILEGTELLPSLAGVTWSQANALSESLRLDLKRKRVRMEILKKESDQDTKYELFQRLNTGGTKLEPQEVRNCVLVMVNKTFYRWFERLSGSKNFLQSIDISESKLAAKYDMELVLRYLALRHIEYTRGRDVHDYLDEAARRLPTRRINWKAEHLLFERVFDAWHGLYGGRAFRVRHTGPQFSLAAFEVLTVGASHVIEKSPKISARLLAIRLRAASSRLWRHPLFKRFSGMGIRGSDRIFNLGCSADIFFKT